MVTQTPTRTEQPYVVTTFSPIKHTPAEVHRLHKHWMHAICADMFPDWEVKFLRMLVEKYPHLVKVALHLRVCGKGFAESRTTEFLTLEQVCFEWRLYQYCKELPGCKCPPDIAELFA